MKPQWYFDIRVAQAISERGPSGSAIAALAGFIRVAHGAAKLHGFSHASALPGLRSGTHAHPGTVLRIFCQDRDHCDVIAQAIEDSPVASSTALVSRVRPVPVGVTQGVMYQRVRTPSRKAAAQVVNGLERRAASLKRGDAMAYLRAFSRSTGQQFSLRIEARVVEQGPSLECSPDSYGLAVRTRPFFLPLLPLQPAPWERMHDQARAGTEVDA